MKLSWIRIVVLALIASTGGYGDSYSGQQCPNFSATEQPYFYLYTWENYEGVPLYLTNVSVPDLAHVRAGMSYTSYFDDKAASVRVRGKWRVCTDADYRGKCAEISSPDWIGEQKLPDVGEKLGASFEKSISSVQLLSCSEY